jgi:hypothetical protein
VIRRELHRIDKRHSLFVALVGHGDNLALFILSLPATHRTVGRTVLALMETPAAIYKDGKLSRLI